MLIKNIKNSENPNHPKLLCLFSQIQNTLEKQLFNIIPNNKHIFLYEIKFYEDANRITCSPQLTLVRSATTWNYNGAEWKELWLLPKVTATVAPNSHMIKIWTLAAGPPLSLQGCCKSLTYLNLYLRLLYKVVNHSTEPKVAFSCLRLRLASTLVLPLPLTNTASHRSLRYTRIQECCNYLTAQYP